MCFIAGAAAATFTVTTTADSGAGSLRQALADAKTQGGSSTVNFAPALSGQTITLASQINVNDPTGAVMDVTIDAASLPSGLTISGNNSTKILVQQHSTSSLTLRGLSLIKGYTLGNGGAIETWGVTTLEQCTFSGNRADRGGAIYALKTLTMTDCTLSGNLAVSPGGSNHYGGAIYNAQGALTLTRCSLSGNLTSGTGNASAPNYGGAIYNSVGPLTLTDCTLSGNQAQHVGYGGAIYNDSGLLTLTRCTLSGNQTTAAAGGTVGGAIYSNYTTSLAHCTLSGNKASSGGAIYFTGSRTLTLTHCTISANVGGGIEASYRAVMITNSIIAGNIIDGNAPSDIRDGTSTITRAGVNMIGSNDFIATVFPSGLPNINGDYVGTSAAPLNPLLAPLASNGGLTQTMALLPGSHARNHASVLSPPLTADQRGLPIVSIPDIGALEDQFGVLSRPVLVTNGALSSSVLCSLKTDGIITATSSNAALIPNDGIVITGTGLSRTITVTPTGGQTGVSTLALTHGPSGDTDTFEVYVLPANYVASSIGDIANQAINEDAGTVSIPFTVTNAASMFGFTVSAKSSNIDLVPNTAIAPGGIGASRNLALTPVANANGTTTITVTVSDGATTASDTFLLTVNAVNDAPSFTKGADQVASSNVTGARTIETWGNDRSAGPPDEFLQTLSFIVTNDRNDLFAVQPTVQPAVNNYVRLTYTPKAGTQGIATVSVMLKDNGGTANGGVDSSVQTFTITLSISSTPTVVTSAADSGPGTLRDAIMIAALTPGAEVITFAPALSGQTITLSSGPILSGDLTQDSATIDASALPGGLTISGNNAKPVFHNTGNLTLIGLTLANGKTASQGGAIYNLGTLTLTRCTLSGNVADFSVFAPNNRGGAIYNDRTTERTGILTLTQCTLFNNRANSQGGGAIGNKGTLTLTHCTLSGNIASTYGGGGIYNTGDLTLTNNIIAGNSGGDLGGDSDIYSASFAILLSSGVNLIGKNNGSAASVFPAGSPNAQGNYVGTSASPLDPRLAPLGNYGGPTQTMALLPGSLARDHAGVLTPAITTDQRAFPIVGIPDIGAYESGIMNSFTEWSLQNTGAALSFTADGDKDGQANGLEYATRTNPLIGSVNPLTCQISGGGVGTVLSFPYRAGATDLRYIIQRSTNFTVWTEIYRYDTSTGTTTETGVSSQQNGATQIITVTDPATGSANFWKLRVELVP